MEGGSAGPRLINWGSLPGQAARPLRAEKTTEAARGLTAQWSAAGRALGLKTQHEAPGVTNGHTALPCSLIFNVMVSEQEASNMPEGSHLIALTSFCKRAKGFKKKKKK